MRICGATCAVILAMASSAAAQEARFAPVALDSDVSIDRSVDGDGNTTGNVVFDSVATVRIGSQLEAIVRPYLQRLTNGEWNWQVWEAEIRYERPGRVGLRVDAGLIPSPVGYANLQLRPHLNPTIAQPASLFQPLPLLDPHAPRATLLGAVYADGGSVTVSGRHWDARGAVIDTSPLRPRRTFGYPSNPRFTNVVLGAGVTPFVGLRIGTSITHGGWLSAGESPSITADRDATIVTIESEFSYRYTLVGGEWTHDAVETTTDDTAHASGWFVQGRQTLAPRWFAAGRVERMSSDAATSTGYTRQYLTGFEEVIAFRITPELTIRGGHRARETFGRDTFAHAGEISIVWAKRWF
jgi:hypothetical protein